LKPTGNASSELLLDGTVTANFVAKKGKDEGTASYTGQRISSQEGTDRSKHEPVGPSNQVRSVCQRMHVKHGDGVLALVKLL
jgi:hypothetical protein